MDPKMRKLVDHLLAGYQRPAGTVGPVRVERRVPMRPGPGPVTIESRTPDPMARQLALARLLLGGGGRNAAASGQSVED